MDRRTILLLLQQLVLLVLICAAGTAIDWAFHKSLADFNVAPDYFTVNILLGPVWAVLVFRVFRLYFKKWQTLAVLISFNEAFLLQTEHYLEKYPIFFVLFFMVIHFLFYLGPALLIFRKFRITFELE